MHLSRYTSILPATDDYSLIFSAWSDRFIISHNSAFKVVGDEITPATETLAAQLKESRAVVDECVDEVAELKERLRALDEDPHTFELHINPTLDCNFRCWYCYENHLKLSRMSDDVRQRTIKFVRNLVEESPELRSINLSFFGGEPLMYFDKIAQPIIRECESICSEHNVNLHVHFTTNAALFTEKIFEALKDVDVSFQITLDGHREKHDTTRCFVNGRGSYDMIITNVKRLLALHKFVILRINFTTDNIGSVSEVIDDLKSVDDDARRYLSVDFQRVWQERPTIPEDEIVATVDSYSATLKDLGIRHTHRIMFSRGDTSCYGDKLNNILINYDGNLFFCTARDFAPQKRAGYLDEDGRIVWDDPDVQQRRMSAKFSREVCYRCKVAPLCGGGCRQKAVEFGDRNACLHNLSEDDIKELILKRFRQQYLSK